MFEISFLLEDLTVLVVFMILITEFICAHGNKLTCLAITLSSLVIKVVCQWPITYQYAIHRQLG